LVAEKPRFSVWAWLIGGNPFLRVGVVVLFFGVAFLLRYAAEHVRFPVALRFAAVAAAGIVLLAIGWRLRSRRPAYALVLQGAAVGILFLTTFAAYRLVPLLTPAVAFVLLAALAAFCALLAVVQDSRALAVAGVSGGFLAPLLASTGAGSHVALFGYYLVLDAGILAIAWFKAWRVLNVVGFAFTFLVGSLWGARFYRPELLPSTAPFLATFFLFYVAIALLFARREALALRSAVDATIVFGTPLVAFVLLTRLLADIEHGAAFAAAAACLFYLVLAAVLARKAVPGLRLLARSFLAVAIAFATVAVPLALDAQVTAATWAVEGAAVLWVSLRQRQSVAQVCGVLLQLAAGFAYLLAEPQGPAQLPVVNGAAFGAAIVGLGGLACAWLLERAAPDRRDWRYGISWLLFCWGAAFWLAAGLLDIGRFVASPVQTHAVLLFLAATCAAASLLRRALSWRQARSAAWVLLPLLLVFFVADAMEVSHPSAHLGWLAWPVAAAVHLALLARHEEEGAPAHAYHALGLLLVTALATWELRWWIGHARFSTPTLEALGWALVPIAAIGLLGRYGMRLAWPIARHPRAYLRSGAGPIALVVLAWVVGVNFAAPGDAGPFPYVPLLNALDLVQAGAFAALAAWLLALDRHRLAGSDGLVRNRIAWLGGVAVFVWLSAMLARTLHHWAGVPFDFAAMARSMLVQTSLSIFWTTLALGAMVFATRRGLRPLWMAGAGLMAVVTVKLFFVDLSQVGGIGRIVSFLAVGLLLLLIGYFSPAPPKQAQ
jgi:uncharacterized membrane protein